MAGEADIYGSRIANGGAGTVSTGSVRAPDYRQVQGYEGINTNLPDNAAAARAQALGSLFKEFEGISSNVQGKLQQHAGALAGAASGDTGHPQYREGLARLTAYGNAFNNAATGAYAVQAEAQADADAARLRVQANNDPATFQATFTANRDAVLKNAPADAVPMLTSLYNKKLAAGVAAISGDQAAELQLKHRQTYEIGIQQQTSRVANLQGSENPHDQLEAADEHVKLTMLIDGGVNSGLYSPAEAQAMQVNSMRAVTAQVFEIQFDRELARPDGDAPAMLERFRQAHIDNLQNTNEPTILSQPEFEKLMGDAKVKLQQQRLIDSMNRSQGRTAEQLKYEAGDREYTARLFDHTLTVKMLGDADRNRDLKPETARALGSALQNEATMHTDPQAYERLTHDPNFLDMDPKDIAIYPGISVSDKKKAMDEQTHRNATWENTQPVKQAKGAISAALKIPPGTLVASLSDGQRKALTDSTQEFIGLMNKTDPAHRDTEAPAVAQEVIKHAQQRQAAEDAQTTRNSITSATKDHGPGAPNEWSKDKFEAYIQQKQQLLQQQIAAAKGP